MAEGESTSPDPGGAVEPGIADGAAPFDAPHPNGAVVTRASTKARHRRRRLIVGALILFAAAWTVALVYSVTAGGRSPERLDDATATAVASACTDAQHALSALPAVATHPTPAELANRVAEEDRILGAMVDHLRTLHPKQSTPAIALTGWLDDWQRLVTAREHYARDLRTEGTAARFLEPVTSGIDPVPDKMNNWTLEQGTRTDSCNTGELQAEVVAAPRVYGPVSKS